MANVFVSYAREDSAKATMIAKVLSQRGWSVWWDRTIPAGKTFDEVIEAALDGAVCVVVLWSKASISSHWVRAEAAEGARRGILVPAILEDARIPLEFRRLQAANLTSWNGDSADPQFEHFVRSIATLIRPSTPGRTGIDRSLIHRPAFDSLEGSSPRDLREPSRAMGRRSYVGRTVAAIAIVAGLAGGLAWWFPWSRAGVPRVSKTPVDESRSRPPQSSVAPVVAPDSRVAVPTIVGLRVDDARAQLERIGLKVGSVQEANKSGVAGTITAQRPIAGERVSLGAAIDLVVAAPTVAKSETTPRVAPNPKSENRIAQDVEVPALSGLAIAVARDRLARRGLTVGRVSARAGDGFPVDTVLSQEPLAGTRQPSGTPISLVIVGEPRAETPLQVNAITNIRAIERSPSEVTFDADVFYDGTRGADGIRLTASVMNGRVSTSGFVGGYPSLRVGANHVAFPLTMRGNLAEFVSTEVNLCIRADAQRAAPILCQAFPLAKKWVLPTNVVTAFRGNDRSTSELVVSVALWYDGSLGTSRISLQACPRGEDKRTRVSGIRCGQAPLQLGANNVSLTMTMTGDAQMLESAAVEVCLVGPRYFECQVFPHEKRWSR